ncbi:DUF4389 domain-containing protein [Aeromicrobium terrae]|uniref:DUF4389 domain-containing protein n=1 Tax=Aeromicrobium terrae TaxID=2498846 RepID=A0A5C8NG43_9ACTN|nr:DUF4389 domain-containing protein [Aeromicrobium terrae]TXL56548.1 DUF4389 domain-containing protein [Aeromicrobium terrae]
MTDETVTPAAGTPASGYPITYTFDTPEKIARWRPLVHWLLAIPHIIVLYVLGIVAELLAVVSWIVGVITGTVPEGLQKPIIMYVRYSARVGTYLFWLREEYPPFAFDTSFDDPGTDPRVRIDVVPSTEGRNRLTIFFRLLLAIPQFIVLALVGIAVGVVVFVGWFAVIILGRWPEGMGRFVIGVSRWNTRLVSYVYLLTDEYPPFSTQ